MSKINLRYEINAETDCWIVTSHKPNGRGYVYFTKYSERDLIHRIIYRDKYGWIPQYNEVRHQCGEKKCMNPEHLYLVEAKNNPAFYRKRTLSY